MPFWGIKDEDHAGQIAIETHISQKQEILDLDWQPKMPDAWSRRFEEL